MTGFQYGGATWGTEEGGVWSSDHEALRQEWEIDGIIADRLVGPYPPVTIGEEVPWSFKFRPSTHGDHIERYLEIRERAKWSHAVVTDLLLDGTPKYKEQHNQDIDLLVSLEAGGQTVAVEGIWGVITGYEEQTTYPQKSQTVTLQVFKLADLDEYESKEEVREVHEI